MYSDNFSLEVNSEADKIVSKDFIKDRLLVEGITIDGPTSKDLDDAISLTKGSNCYHLQVTISDISECISVDSNLFNEAFKRVETLYRKSFNIPMLPRSLSEEKLSLNENGIKPSLTFFIDVDFYGNIIRTSIKETAFKSKGQFNYHTFDDIKVKNDHKFSKDFSELSDFAGMLLEIRRQKGALAIYDFKQGFATNEEGQLIQLKQENAYKSYIVVQETMILANKAIAIYAAENNVPLLYRNHLVKSFAPSRNDIIDQMKIATSNLQYIDSLREKVNLWFERAKYSPILLGHFGLNEAAYTHVTSPLRRFADFINHILIKDHLNNCKNKINQEELTNISNHINEVILKNKEAESEFFKNRMIKTFSQKLNSSDTRDLLNLSDSDFNNIIRASIEKNICSEILITSLDKKILDCSLDNYSIFLILNKPEISNNIWTDAKIKVLRYIYSQKGMGYSIINIMLQKGLIEEFNFEEWNSEQEFYAVGKGKIIGNIVVSREVSANRKKDAQHFASFDFLREFQQIEINHFDDLKILNVEKNNISEEIKTENSASVPEFDLPEGFDQSQNYINRLLEYCQKNGNKPQPVYTFKQTGLSHSPTIYCNASLKIWSNIFEVESISKTNKMAKQIASYLLLEDIYKFRNIQNTDL